MKIYRVRLGVRVNPYLDGLGAGGRLAGALGDGLDDQAGGSLDSSSLLRRNRKELDALGGLRGSRLRGLRLQHLHGLGHVLGEGDLQSRGKVGSPSSLA